MVPKDAFKKHFLCFVRDDFPSRKKHVISTPLCLTLLFQKNVINERVVGWLESGVMIRRG